MARVEGHLSILVGCLAGENSFTGSCLEFHLAGGCIFHKVNGVSHPIISTIIL